MFDTKNQRNETCVLTENRKELTEEKQYFFFDKMRAFLVMTVFIQATFGLLDIAQNVCDFGEHNQLKCFMRTLQSDGINQVNSILNDIEKLNIVCSDSFFYESILSPKHLGNLPNLHHLQLQYCKIRQIPQEAFRGLDHLHSVRFYKDHNS